MLRPTTILFETEYEWDGNRGGVVFWALADGEHVRCFVSRKAIHDAFGGTGQKDDLIREFDENRLIFEADAAALINSDRLEEVSGESFREAQILDARIRHRPMPRPVRRVTVDELQGSAILQNAKDISWWVQASGQPVEKIIVVTDSSGVFGYVDVAFETEQNARNFDYTMGKFGVLVFRLQPEVPLS